MVVRRLQQASGLPSVIFLVLLLISIAGFVGVNHLVVRFHEQEKALGRRLYAQADSEQAAGRTENAIPYLRRFPILAQSAISAQPDACARRYWKNPGSRIVLDSPLGAGPSGWAHQSCAGQAFRARKRSDSQHSVLPQCRIRAVAA